MRKEQLRKRYNARHAHLTYNDIKYGTLSDREAVFKHALKELQQAPNFIHLVDEPVLGPSLVEAKLLNLQQSGSQKTGKDRLSPKLNVKK